MLRSQTIVNFESMNILLLSSSRVADTGYLEHAQSIIINHLGSTVRKLLFIPYAGVLIGFDSYATVVTQAFEKFGYQIDSIHQHPNPIQAIEQAEAIVVGGGNTFCLLNSLYQNDLIEVIKRKVNHGTPYIGWSAGSNLAGPSIRTTNDMPIIEPPSFEAFNFVPFQINPHYFEGNPPGHRGETREQRINEFLIVNPDKKIIGIPEGCGLRLSQGHLTYFGIKPGVVFHSCEHKELIQVDSNLDFLMLKP